MLIVFDAMIDDERRKNAFGLMMSLNMLIETPAGFDYTVGEGQSWLRDTGFKEVTPTYLGGPDSMIVGIKYHARSQDRPSRTFCERSHSDREISIAISSDLKSLQSRGRTSFGSKVTTARSFFGVAILHAKAPSYKQAGIAFVLYTDDLPATLVELKQRGLVPSGNDGSAKCPTFADPDGHWFQVVNPQDH